ncbi:MAG: hypothetical protein ACLTBV_25295 [Enterocloster bolteae]
MKNWGMNEPVCGEVCATHLEDALHGDFGTSYRTRQPVFDEIFSASFGVTFRMVCFLSARAAMTGCSHRRPYRRCGQHSGLDAVSTILAIVAAAVPQFWLAMMFVMLFFARSWAFRPSTFTGEEWSP